MQVLHILKGLGLAGAENHLMTLLAGLREQGIDARLLLWVSADKSAEDIVTEAQKRGIPIERWVMPGNFAPGFFMKLVRYLRQQKPDIVHTHLVHAETYAIPAARLAGVPMVVNSSHNDDPFRHHPVFKVRSRILWRLTHQGIAISDAIRQFLIEVEGAKPEQVRTIYYGLTPSPALGTNNSGVGENVRMIGSVCRLVPQKGISYALEAVKLLLPYYPTLKYMIVGDGVLRNELEQQAKKLGISTHVHFLGWRQDVKEQMAQFEIFLAPSLWEGFGLVFLEAMGQALPIVTSRVSAIPEVVQDGITGILVPPQNSDALAEAIKKLLDNPDLAQKMGAAGHERLETVFAPQHMIDQTAALYGEAKHS
ncbi:MAG: glycosyltransferase family 4 protein [Anaerolineae bacterium]|nr:glycosyltransferase family 4 protein [Anaerolineae bacterium]